MQMARALNVSMLVYFMSGRLPSRNSRLSTCGMAETSPYAAFIAADSF